jgi:hypothetical protein
MCTTNIENVTLSPKRLEHLFGCSVDQPKSGSGHDTFCIDLAGWVLGRTSTIKSVEVVSEGRVVQTANVGLARPDVAHGFPASRAAGNCGFRALVNLVGLPRNFELMLIEVDQEGHRGPFGSILGNRAPLGLGDASMLQPLIVTTQGRSGSTWVMRVLGQHHSIVTCPHAEFEARVGTYWAHVCMALSDPNSYLQPLVIALPTGRWWLGCNTTEAAPYVRDPKIVNYLGGTGVRSLSAFCQQQLETFYRTVGAAGGSGGAKYFAEKYLTDPFVRNILWEWYPGTREVVLVRDPRDIFCSIESFNAKRGYAAFDRDRFKDEREYMRSLVRQSHVLMRIYEARRTAVHLLRYEDLVREPERTVAALFQYLEVESGPAIVREVLERASAESSAIRQHQTSRTPADSIGRWRKDLPANLQELCVSEFREILTQLGYE